MRGDCELPTASNGFGRIDKPGEEEMTASAGSSRTRRSYWVVVLAGGEGERMAQFVEHWLGVRRPKQYCSFVGKRTMLEHTLDRIGQIVPRERILTVIGAGHGRFLSLRNQPERYGLLIEQPERRGTAAGVFLPLAYITALDPEAIVLIIPSDHFVAPEADFVAFMDCAGICSSLLPPDSVLLAGIPARGPETDYGWIQPGAACIGFPPGKRVHRVDAFHEKPDAASARHFFGQGWLWNTMIVAARGTALWALGRAQAPMIIERFERLRCLAGGGALFQLLGRDWQVVREIYADIPSLDFSRDLLQSAPERTRVLRMDGVMWDDWGRPERLIATLRRLGRQDNFPVPSATPAD